MAPGAAARGQRNFVGVYFRLGGEEPVLTRHFNSSPVEMTAAEAAALMMRAESLNPAAARRRDETSAPSLLRIMTHKLRPTSYRTGLVAGTASAISFGTMSVLVNLGGGRIPATELAFFRSALILVILTPAALRHAHLLFSRPATALWLRSVAGAASILCGYWTLQHTDVGTATALFFLSPVFVVVLSWKVLKEKLHRSEFAAAALTVSGAVTLGLWGANAPAAGVVFVGVAGAFLAGVSYVSLRRAAGAFSPNLIVWCLSACTAATAVTCGRGWVVPGRAELMIVSGVCLTGFVGQHCLTVSYSHLKASSAGALAVGSLVWAVVLESILKATSPPPESWGSYGMIIAGVSLLYVSRGKPRKKRPELWRKRVEARLERRRAALRSTRA